MAPEQSPGQPKASWTKIFTAFKIALDMKKLLLAAMGIFFTWLGWFCLSWTFYGMRDLPKWEDKAYAPPDNAEVADKNAQWSYFKAKRNSWNLLHELAGSPGDAKPVDAADVASTLDEYDLLKKCESPEGYEQVVNLAAKEKEQKPAQRALEIYKTSLVNPKIKPSGLLRISPWSENRGKNPYLIVADGIKTHGESIAGPGQFFVWLIGDEAPVVLEPLYKFLAPIVYLFDSRAGRWDRLYLLMVLLWTVVIWGFFGGAICRIAAVQIARNERITLKEAFFFTKDRYGSYVAAPVFPMILVGILTVVLMLFGYLEWIPWFGDVFAGLLWPIVIIIGFIMTIVLVGLVGWPLMTATISTEGSDSFDALSRSYSYIYQAPWQYLWYNFLAIVYGAVLVFFIGFMASMMVFVGKWGVSSAVGPSNINPQKDREPSYLFYDAPTSFGWRDLLISSSQFTEVKKEIAPNGRVIERREFTVPYKEAISSWNRFGSVLVNIWIYPLFLLVVGFGYSYFWTASTIIYFLMRRHVDDTELDEVHLEDDEADDPFLKPTPPPTAAPAGKPGTLSLNVVEAPPAAPAPTVVSAGSPAAPPPDINPPPAGSS